MKPRKVLIAVDETRYSWNAVTAYVERLWQKDDNVVVVHCIQQPYLIGYTQEEDILRYTDTEILKAKQLEKVISEYLHRNKVMHRTCFSMGKSPGEFIVLVARREQPDLVITGTRGQSLARRVLMGSVSDYVHRYCPFPVSIVKSKREKMNSTGSFDSASSSVNV